MRLIIFITALALLPVSALANRVAVLPASYTVANSGEETDEPTRMIQEAVLNGVQDAECEAVLGPEVAEAMKKAVPEGAKCEDKACLLSVANEAKADETILVAVTKLGDMEYEIQVVLGHGEEATEQKNDGIYLVAGEVRRLVAVLIQKSIFSRKEAAVGPEPIMETDTTAKEPESVSRNRVSPKVFWPVLGVTGALLAGWAATEIVVYKRYEALKSGGKDKAYWDTTNTLQKLDLALVCLAGAGVVATGVLLFLTDFENENEKAKDQSRAFSIAPVALENGGMMMIHKKF